MVTDFTPEQMFIQTNILYISSADLSDLLKPMINDGQEMISIDCKVLWQLLITDEANQRLALHLDYPKFSEVLSIEFNEEDSNTLSSETKFQTLGILIDFNPDTCEAMSVVFIPNIKEGLDEILSKK